MNPNPAAPDLIAIDALRVGMFVHLEGGWMSHPFPTSNFRIASAEQIATLAGLGLKQVRWSPRRSVIVDAAPRVASDPATSATSDAAASATAAAAPPPLRSAPRAAATAERSATELREAARAERRAQRVCEQQFSEASAACRKTTALVREQPLAAASSARALTGALTDKMIGSHELCVRLLGQAAGDRAEVHAMNVTVLALLLGRVVHLEAAEMLELGVGALLHDIGKLDLPEGCRHVEASFTPAQQKSYEAHVAHGLVHAARMDLGTVATMVIAQHHEHADGSGFPRQLGSEHLCAASRIVSLVDRYDNLCNPRIGANAVTPHEALAKLFVSGRMTYDDAILGAFIRMLGIYPPGSTVQLTDDRYGLVVAANSSRPLRPRVRVHDPRVAPDDALLIDLETTPGLGIRRSLKPAQLPDRAVACLTPTERVAYFFEPALVESTQAECVG